MSSYRDLQVWQKSIRLVTDIYKATDSFPAREMYGLTSQVRRAAVSVASNIAEGQGRRSKQEFRQFLSHARGSLMEVETQVVIAQELHYLSEEATARLLDSSAEVGRMLNGLMHSMAA
jgi:four helix bundle protein